MTAQDVYNIACALMDEIEPAEDESDKVTTDDETRDAKAPFLIDALHRELAKLEGRIVTEPITALTDNLIVSDETASIIMPYGLAAQFALTDRDGDLYADFTNKYFTAQRKITAPQKPIKDKYNIMSGLK